MFSIFNEDCDASLGILDNWEDAAPTFELTVTPEERERVFKLKAALLLRLQNLKGTLSSE